jgi:hypothetical protein
VKRVAAGARSETSPTISRPDSLHLSADRLARTRERGDRWR